MFTNVAHVQHIRKNTATPSYRNTKQYAIWSTVSFCHFPQSISHVQHCFIYWRRGRALRGSSSTLSRPTCEPLCHTYPWNFYCLFITPCCNMVNVSAGDFCSKKHNLILLRSLTRHFLHQRNHTNT